MPRVSVHIVTFNSLPFLEGLLRSLEAQTFTDYSLLIIDNASSDDTVSYLQSSWPQVKLIKNRENVGFARAHNQAIHFTDSEYILVLNPDIVLHERFLERLAEAMDANSKAGSASGKILKAVGGQEDWLHIVASKRCQSPGDRHVLTAVGTRDDTVDIIDSTGIIVDRKRFWRDRGAGEEDRGQYDGGGGKGGVGGKGVVGDIGRISRIRRISRVSRMSGINRVSGIIGPSGAAALYRREALEDVAFQFTLSFPPGMSLRLPSGARRQGLRRESRQEKNNKNINGDFSFGFFSGSTIKSGMTVRSEDVQYFDELYHSYKEDVDLAWRLMRRGWQCVYVPSARLYHFRALSASQSYIKRPSRMVFLSYRNHLYTLVKNEGFVGQANTIRPYMNAWKDLPWIVAWEFGKMVFLLFTRPSVVYKAWRDVVRNWRQLMERRKQILNPKL